MEFVKQIERLKLLNKLIRDQPTGSPMKLASRIGVSRTKLYLILEELRDQGVLIKFNKRINSFVFEECDGIDLEFSFQVLKDREKKLNKI